ncbi:hypothetical protein [Muricoccus aerilatus]|uniref:hypothetical protein n=1 Tax=Muricoccus aerilatus TaxID=452982 RepID=UPI0005C1873F|nr:hypothetical protein [Roseomonas aerilata]
MSRPSRRGVLGGLAALAACAAYMTMETAYNAAFRQQCDAEEAGNKAEERRLDAVQHALAVEQEEPLGVIIKTMATTPAGRAAKAAVAMTLVQSTLAGEPMSKEDALIWSLAEDLAGKPLVPPS